MALNFSRETKNFLGTSFPLCQVDGVQIPVQLKRRFFGSGVRNVGSSVSKFTSADLRYRDPVRRTGLALKSSQGLMDIERIKEDCLTLGATTVKRLNDRREPTCA